MNNISSIKSEEFETLLRWLSEDREKAAAEYNEIRDGLIRFFRFKGCTDPPTLADQVLNRVAAKIPSFDESENTRKISVFYGFASNIFLENFRRENWEAEKLIDYPEPGGGITGSDENSDEPKSECLKKCLNRFSDEERNAFIEYYALEKEKKSAARKRIAARIGCKLSTLQVRIFRMRGVLAECIENCMKKKL